MTGYAKRWTRLATVVLGVALLASGCQDEAQAEPTAQMCNVAPAPPTVVFVPVPTTLEPAAPQDDDPGLMTSVFGS